MRLWLSRSYLPLGLKKKTIALAPVRIITPSYSPSFPAQGYPVWPGCVEMGESRVEGGHPPSTRLIIRAVGYIRTNVAESRKAN